MKRPPDWFLKELAVVDPTYFVVYNEHYDYFEIKRKMNISRKVEIPESYSSDGQGWHSINKGQILKVAIHNPTVAVFKTLNDAAMLELRRRKYLGLKFHRAYRDDAYLDWIVNQNRQAKAKKEELALEMMAEGFIEFDRFEKKHTVSGGSHDPSRASVGGS